MKRRFMCMTFILVLLISAPAYAVNSVEYELEELGLTISIPSDYVVFTRNTSADDPNLSAYGLTKDGLLSFLTESNNYLNAWNDVANQEVFITMVDSPLVDFNLCSDTILAMIATSFEPEYAKMGITVIKTEIYQHSQAKFVKTYISHPNGDATAYGLQYYTVYADKAINIILKSYSGQITSSQESTLKSIVDSASFDTQPQTAETEFVSTTPFTYTDSETQTSFTVPANWVESSLSKTRDYIDVKFVSLEEEGLCIMYGSYDLWNEMTETEKAEVRRSGFNRSDMDNSIITKADVAEMYCIPTDDIKMAIYHGNEYYMATVTSSTSAYGADFSVTGTFAIRIDNGYMYFFQFSGTRDNEFFDDFESMLSSVNYSN
jgi:hypothetical protein